MAFKEEGERPATEVCGSGGGEQMSPALDLPTEARAHITGAPPSEQGESRQKRTSVPSQPGEPSTQSVCG